MIYHLKIQLHLLTPLTKQPQGLDTHHKRLLLCLYRAVKNIKITLQNVQNRFNPKPLTLLITLTNISTQMWMNDSIITQRT